jgi:hypothetical protein
MDQIKILICTNGSKTAEIAAQELLALRFPPETRVIIMSSRNLPETGS